MTLSCPLLIRRERDGLIDILSLYFHLGLLVSSVHRLVRLDGLGGVEGYFDYTLPPEGLRFDDDF